MINNYQYKKGVLRRNDLKYRGKIGHLLFPNLGEIKITKYF